MLKGDHVQLASIQPVPSPEELWQWAWDHQAKAVGEIEEREAAVARMTKWKPRRPADYTVTRGMAHPEWEFMVLPLVREWFAWICRQPEPIRWEINGWLNECSLTERT